MTYWAVDTTADAELRRLRLLEERSDALTRSRIDALGCGAGWSCLEVGAGAGSVARWTASRVGPTGRVVATDTETRFLEGLVPAAVEVRRHDICHDPIDEGAFDLVHSRGLVCHLDDPLDALRRMVRALRPGGWLLVEQSDYISFAACPGHPMADGWNELVRSIGTHEIFDLHMGRRLPAMLACLDLERVDHDGAVRVHRGGSAAARFQRTTFAAMADLLVAEGVTDRDELRRIDAALDDPGFSFMDPVAFAAWGARPSP
jgi:SAM-dependent methyltransferase